MRSIPGSRKKYVGWFWFAFPVSTNRPRCPICTGLMKKNGYTQAGTQRWRCTQGCRGSSVRNSQQASKHAATFRLFYTWITSGRSLNSLAQENNTTRQTLHARMKWCWLIQPDIGIDHNRVYDQLFIDGTYLNKQCLLIAASLTHVVAWLWCDKESTTNYIKLISQLQPH